LSSLDLSWSLLKAPVIAELVKSKWPSLCTLNLIGTSIAQCCNEAPCNSRQVAEPACVVHLSNTGLRTTVGVLAGSTRPQQLSSFSLCNSLQWLDCDAFGHLYKANATHSSQANTAQLETLNLAGISLNVNAMP